MFYFLNVKNQKQLSFEIFNKKGAKHFGGAYLKKSHAKEKRPISTKKAMHLVLRSSSAVGFMSFSRKDRKISEIIHKQARTAGAKIYRFANAGNHLHLIILASSRMAYMKFIRAISGLIARLILNAQRGAPKALVFWDKRPFSRILEWGKDFFTSCRYLDQNTLEALGFIPYKPRKKSKLKLSSA